MKRISIVFLVAAFGLIGTGRMFAPISEENPTPTPTEAAPNDQLQGYSWDGEKFPETRTRLLKREDVVAWDAEKLRYAINEMYARGGYDFRIPDIKQIFLQFTWYRERLVNGRTQDEAYAHLSALERTNLELLQAVRRGK